MRRRRRRRGCLRLQGSASAIPIREGEGGHAHSLPARDRAVEGDVAGTDAVPADVDTTILTVTRPPADKVWAIENALKLYRATIDQQAQTLPDRFTTTLLKVFRHDAVNELHWLDPIYVSWAVDQQKQAA